MFFLPMRLLLIQKYSAPRMGTPYGAKATRQEFPSRQRLGTYYQRLACLGRPYLPVSAWRSNFADLRCRPCSEPLEEWALL